MNLVLFDKDELDHPLVMADERAQHIHNVLRLKSGDRFQVGLINGARGIATIRSLTKENISLDFQWDETEDPPLDPITLIVGLSRPHTCQKILQQATTLGAKRLIFVRTELGEGSYAASKLWRSGDYKRHLLLGAQQAGSTRIPVVEYGTPLWIALRLIEDKQQKIVLHNGDGITPLSQIELVQNQDVALAVGSERGWTDKEITMFRRNGFELADMGRRILRTETAVVAALALTKTTMGLW